MQDPKLYPLPFLVRDMLAFEYAASIELVITARSKSADEINVVGATREGLFKYTFLTNTSVDTAQVVRFAIPDLPIWISITDRDGAIVLGAVYIKADLAINGDTIHALTSGYVYNIKSLSWPAVNLETAEGHKGAITVIESADPAAGTELSITVPLGEEWKIKAMRFQFVTAATVGTRNVHVTVEINGAPIYTFFTGNGQIISQTLNYSLYPLPTTNDLLNDNDISMPIPDDIIVPGGDIIKTETVNLAAGDNFGKMQVYVERFIKLTPN